MAGLDLSVDAGAYFGINPSMLDGDGLAAVQDILWEIVFSWREVLQDAWPRDTGLSFASWRSVVRGLTLEVSNPVEYAEYVHPVGEPEGASGEYMEEALDRLLSGATAQILRVTIDSEARRASGFALAANQITSPQQFGNGLAAAQARAFAEIGGRARQQQVFPGQPLGQPGRTVLAQLGGVLVRFRQRIRERVR